MESVWSRPSEQRAGTPLLLMLHGYGSDESTMSALFERMPAGFSCAALRGPRNISEDWGWFLLDYFLSNDFAEVMQSASAVLAWLDTAMAAHKFSSVSLLGYSQGMAMATTLMRLRPELFTAGVGLSGFVLQNDLLATMDPLPRRIPFLWARDLRDPVINPKATAFTAEWLKHNTELSHARYEGLGHGINATELSDVSAFLTGQVPGSFLPGA